MIIIVGVQSNFFLFLVFIEINVIDFFVVEVIILIVIMPGGGGLQRCLLVEVFGVPVSIHLHHACLQCFCSRCYLLNRMKRTVSNASIASHPLCLRMHVLNKTNCIAV